MKTVRYQLYLLCLLLISIAKPVVAKEGERINTLNFQQTIYTDFKDLLLVQNNITRVTGIEINQTESGLELIITTVAGSERLVPLIVPEGNDLVIDIIAMKIALLTLIPIQIAGLLLLQLVGRSAIALT